MSIISTIERQCQQTAVYWGNPVAVGDGDYTFDSPVEIQCRWEDRNEIFIDAMGDEKISKSVVFVLQDVDNEGYLYLGTLDSIYDTLESSGAPIDPKDVEGANIIKRFDKIPALGSTTQFFRRAYLTSKNMI